MQNRQHNRKDRYPRKNYRFKGTVMLNIHEETALMSQIEKTPSYAALGMLFGTALEHVANAIWDEDPEKAIELISNYLITNDQVEAYYAV